MTDQFAPSALDLGTEFTGEALTPDAAGYDDARRVFNGMIDLRPALIARCRTPQDVAAAIATARRDGLPLSVHGGGHSVTGHGVADGGVMIDLRPMSSVVVDPEARTARVGGGATWGDVDKATQEHGLAVTGGRVPSTGVGGFTLGSGSGWIERKYGLACDSLRSCEVVTADGRVVRASEDDNADLFWGLRGGGGNFGVVTEFEFDLHPVGPMVYGGMLIWPFSEAGRVLRAWRDFVADAPDELGGGVALITAPNAPFVPEPARGKLIIAIVACYLGSPEVGEVAYAPLRALEPAADLLQPMPYLAVQGLIEAGNPPGKRNYWSSDFLSGLPDEAIDTLLEHRAMGPSPIGAVTILAGGGAIARVSEDATAFGERRSPFNVHYLTMWESEELDEACIGWTRAMAAAMKRWTTGGVYLNFIGDEGAERIRDGFGEERYARLVAIKDRWDPENVFRLNQNIPPSSLGQ